MRIIIYTGKGGVGKTSMAAATACKIAKGGKRVLIMSTDQAHSLGDSFDIKIGREPTKVSGRLYAMEVDTVYEGEFEGIFQTIPRVTRRDGNRSGRTACISRLGGIVFHVPNPGHV